jgi:hypothetical protein
MAIGDKYFEVIKELKSLTNDVNLEMQRRIKTANRCFFGLRKNLLYRSETWVLKRVET